MRPGSGELPLLYGSVTTLKSQHMTLLCARNLPQKHGYQMHLLSELTMGVCNAWQVALLLVVAGYQHLDSLADVDAAGLRQHFEVNSIGPLLAVQALRPWLAAGTKARLSPSQRESFAFHQAR